jgi:hypothetical protein
MAHLELFVNVSKTVPLADTFEISTRRRNTVATPPPDLISTFTRIGRSPSMRRAISQFTLAPLECCIFRKSTWANPEAPLLVNCTAGSRMPWGTCFGSSPRAQALISAGVNR